MAEEGLSKRSQERFTGNPLWAKLKGEKVEVDDATWMTAVGLIRAHVILDDLAEHYKVDPARKQSPSGAAILSSAARSTVSGSQSS